MRDDPVGFEMIVIEGNVPVDRRGRGRCGAAEARVELRLRLPRLEMLGRALIPCPLDRFPDVLHCPTGRCLQIQQSNDFIEQQVDRREEEKQKHDPGQHGCGNEAVCPLRFLVSRRFVSARVAI